MGHRNSRNNEEPHHLYEIVDKKDYDTFKYGISSNQINEKDGLSERMRTQVKAANLIVDWARFFARVLIKNIPGRKEARRLEREHIQAYTKKHGRRPKGNLAD